MAGRETFVHIVLPGETRFTVAGRFRAARLPAGGWRGEFVYGRSYLARANAVELDPVELTLGRQVRETVRLGGFFGALRDAMPDAWGRRLIEVRLGRPARDEFEVLREGGPDRAGALGFAPTVSPPAATPTFPAIPELRDLAESIEAVFRGETPAASDPAARVLFPGNSLGGARPKLTVREGGSLWLAKFPLPTDRWDEARTEHALLQLAAGCGIRPAASRAVTIGGRSVLLVRRFDRTPARTGMLRRRLVSALTLLRADEGVTDRQRWSYLALADEVRRASIRPRRDLEELFTRMAFNGAVGNTDDHPRNHAMIAGTRGWRLSPAYDLTPTPAVSAEPPRLAMDCGFRGRAASRENLLSGAGRFLLDLREAAAILDSVAAQVQSGWEDAMRDAGVSVRDRRMVASAFVRADSHRAGETAGGR